MSWLRIIGPIFFDTTVNTDVYLDIFEQFVNQLDDPEFMEGYFHEDGAMSCWQRAWQTLSPFLATGSFQRGFAHHSRQIQHHQTSSYGVRAKEYSLLEQATYCGTFERKHPS